MRTIKFRGLRVDGKGWAYGDLQRICDTRKGGTWVKIYVDSLDVEDSGEYYTVVNSTVGQFTGLLDKNGKELFEDDVAKYYNRIGVIVYSPDRAGYCLFSKEDNIYVPLGNPYISNIKQLGNIHQHPHLIK
jgi:uncharacterized phage protein (TIGR01671 family)